MKISVAAVALNQTPLDWAGNEKRARAALAEARGKGAALVCLPELCLTGYGCEDAFHSPATWQRAWRILMNLLPETRGLVAAFGLPVLHQHALFNVSALVADGILLGLAAKRNLAGDGIHYEPRWFKPWPAGVRDEFNTPDGNRVPIGDLMFDIGGVKLGFEICEDAWVAERPGVRLAARGVDVILNPSASHFAFGKSAVRRRFVTEGSRAFGTAYVYSNLLGNEAGRVIYDGQLLIAGGGHLLAESPRFSYTDHQVLACQVDLNSGRLATVRSASHRPELPAGAEAGLVRHDFTWPAGSRIEAQAPPPPEEDSQLAEFTRAVSLGLFDYLRKSRSSGYVVSLSGGADSAAAVCLIRLMYEAALAELGDDFGGKMPPLPFSELLVTAYQATESSGIVTRSAARTLAEALGATHYELDVSEIHKAYVAMIGGACGRPLAWVTDDIALQNIQARVRSPGIWMIANLRNALLVSTSNRSEAAVGYATMDGDTSGGLAPLSGIDKAFLLEWLRWLETTGPMINGRRRPVPELSVINAQKPTAELRTSTSLQTDEDDLMPYDILDFIEGAAIRDRKTPAEVLAMLQETHHTHPDETLRLWVRRFFTLWSRNQWKRERYAPGFHLDDENLDPKTWCRWPILSGGFSEELTSL